MQGYLGTTEAAVGRISIVSNRVTTVIGSDDEASPLPGRRAKALRLRMKEFPELYCEHLESRTAEGDVGAPYAVWLRDCRPGVWARPHARAMKRVRDIAKVVVAGRDPDEVAAFVAGFGAQSASSRGDRGGFLELADACDIGQPVDGRRLGRTNDGQITVSRPIGVAATAVTGGLVAAAPQFGVGTHVQI